MLRKLYLVPVLALFLVPAVSNAQFKAGDWDLQIAGSGTAVSGGSVDTGNFNFQGQLGYLVTKEIEVGLRQSIIWADGGSAMAGSTGAFADYIFDLDRWQPYVGVGLGYQYGDNTEDSWIATPEAGVKYFVNATTYIDGSVGYSWDLNNGLDQGGYVFRLGLGFTF